MPCDSLCCICLESECTFLTDCCKNKMHTKCIINWLVYKGEFNCPLCRSDTMRVPLNDLLTTPILEYGLKSSEISNNMNKLLRSYNTQYHIVIDIPEERNTCLYCLPRRYLRYRVRRLVCGVTLKNILYILCIPLFYAILFVLMQNFYLAKNRQYVEID